MNKNLLILVLTILVFTLSACGQKKSQAANQKTVTASKLFGANLIKNGGAESGDASPWKSEDELKTFDYSGGWGDAWQVTPPNKGEKYFYVSVKREKPVISFTQEFDVSEIAKEIDENRVGYNLDSWYGVRGVAAGSLKAEFYDAKNGLISRPKDADATEKITSANKPNDVTMIEKTHGGDVPAGTRKIKITLEFYLFEEVSKENEGETALADNLSFALNLKQ